MIRSKGSKILSAQNIALLGMLMAMQLILTRFLAIETPFVRIGFLFVPTALMAMIFGPLLTGAASALSDFIGFFLFSRSAAPFFPGFTISAFVSGLFYGFFFYKKEITWRRVIIAVLLDSIIIDVLANTFWLYLLMGPGTIAQIPVRITKAVLLFPIKVGVIYYMGNQSIIKKEIKKFRTN